MESEEIPVNPKGREYRKKRVEELGSALAQIRARVKATRGSGPKKDDDVEQSGGSKVSEDTERTALTKKILEEDRARFSKLQQNRVRMKEEYNQILIEREEQKKVEKQLQETIAKVTAPTPELSPAIKQRIIDLETNVDNLKERLSEKDKVLSSKTQALTVLHNQLMQRSQEQVEKAMSFTQEISKIKEDFGRREEHLKKEITRLKEREEELELRLSDKETHGTEVESLQTELAEVKKELNEAISKTEESVKALESINKVNIKLKAQYKALKVERDKLKQALEGIEDIDGLKNQIALLEEEKGNLQLQLVDFDDFKEAHVKIESLSTQLQEDLIKLRENNQVLEEEKSSLQACLSSANIKIQEQESTIESLRSSLKNVEEQKISAEIRSIEIEEKMETLQNNISSQLDTFKAEIHSLQSQIDEKNSIIDSLSNQLSLKEQEIFDIKGNNFHGEVETDRLREIEYYNSELVEKVRELQIKCENNEQTVIQLNESLSERNDTINGLKIKCDELKTIVSDLNNNKSSLENELQSLKSSKDAHNKESHEVKEDVNLKFKKLAANYKIKVRLCQELEEKLKSATEATDAKSSEILDLSSQLNDLKVEVEDLRNKETALNSDLENVKARNEQLLKLLDELVPKLEAMEAEKSTALIKADRMNKAFEELREWKDGDSKLLKEHVSSVNSMASNVSLLEQELGNLQSILNEKNSVIGELECERKKLVDDMRNSELELERLRGLYEQESFRNQSVLTNLEGLESEMLVSRGEMNQIAEQLDAVTKNYHSSLMNLQERENYIEALEQDIVGMKTKMYNLESGIGDRHRLLEERGNQLSARLEEAEILTQTFDKYQAEMDKKFKLMEDNENVMKDNLSKLQNEIDQRIIEFNELSVKHEASEKQITEMAEEIDNLKNVRNSYNMTLDTIEILNGDLKQVMCEFESKNQELIRLGEERTELINKLTDVEDSYSDLKERFDESEENYAKLQSELSIKTNALENSLLQVKSLEKEINELRKASHRTGAEVKQPLDLPEEMKVFSWDQHSQHQVENVFPSSLVENNSIQVELEEKKNQLLHLQQEINYLQSQITSILHDKDNEISLLKDEILRLTSECNNLKSQLTETKSIECPPTMFSWDQHQESATTVESLRSDLEKSQNQLILAEQEISNLRSSVNSMLIAHETELSHLQAEIQKLLMEKSEYEKISSHQIKTSGNAEIQMFSWGEHGQSNVSDNTIVELKEKTDMLKKAELEISNLQNTLSKMLNEKDTEISDLKEKVKQLLNRVDDLGNNSNPEIVVPDSKESDIKMFSWGQNNQEGEKDDEDGWGWMGAEAHLEQDHKHSEAKIQTLTLRIEELEADKNTLTEKLNSSKLKCLKLIKKLKDIETLQEQSKSERNVGFSDLDFALQEELRAQIDQLETKNKELTVEISNVKLERDNLRKKADVLISANEQLIDMKERQDIEVQMWQKRNAELKNEMQGLQWSVEELKSEAPHLSQEGGELSDKLNALAAENENLQSIILNLKAGQPLGNPNIILELQSLKDELKKLKDIRMKEKESFETELRKANEELDSVEQQLDLLSKENQALNSRLNEMTSSNEVTKLNEQIKTLNESNKQYQDMLSTVNSSSSDLERRIDLLMNENSALRNQLSNFGEMANELNALKQSLQLISDENKSLKENIGSDSTSKQEISSLLDKIQSLGFENADLKDKLSAQNSQPKQDPDHAYQMESLLANLDYVTSGANVLREELQNVSAANQSLSDEINSTRESFISKIHQYEENLEKSQNDLKNLENSMKLLKSELTELEMGIDEIVMKYKISVSSGTKIEKLKQVLIYIDNILSANSQLSNEITSLKNQLLANQNTSSANQFGSTPPVFKGFSSFSNDPFDNIQSNQHSLEIEKLKTETIELKSVINTYELELSRLNSEKICNEQIITDLKSEISLMNEHVAKINLQRSNHTEDLRAKLERADLEISRWREETNNLRREITNLVEKHSQEMEELRRNDAGSKEKLSEIEENYQNTMLNKDQESGYLKQILSEKEQLLANAINEKNALQTQFESISQQIFSLENRVRDMTRENEELQSVLNHSRRDENTVIERQKEEIQELMAKLEYLSQSQNLRTPESENEKLLKKQIKDMSENISFLEQSISDMQTKFTAQSEEVLRLKMYVSDLESRKLYLESVVTEKQKKIDSMGSEEVIAQEATPDNVNNTSDKLSALIKQKDVEIARVSKVLLDTQERLVQVQDSKSIDKIMSLQTRLDQALYRVHELDVRCDELTREIMQLLEERDGLQLRLSEALRENAVISKGVSESSLSSPQIKDKLGELHENYKRDPAVQMDMESRHIQQMELYTERDKEGANAPVDYGIFNWFFSSPSPQPQQQS